MSEPEYQGHPSMVKGLIHTREDLAAKGAEKKAAVGNPTHFDMAITSLRNIAAEYKADPDSQDVLSGMVMAATIVESLRDAFDDEVINLILDTVMSNASVLAYSQVHGVEDRKTFDDIISRMAESMSPPPAPQEPKTEAPSETPELPGYL